MYTTENFSQASFKPAHFESDHVLPLNGQQIPYHTVSEDTVFYDSTGKPIASVFSYSYLRSDVKDTTRRPVLFGFNGGPGSCSMYVHAGLLGTRRMVYGKDPDRPTALGPYEVIDNPECLLDIADIVLIDPVATGYGLLLDPDSGKQFFGLEEDAEALLIFIEKWLHEHNRWLSPKYLLGESYGCTRAAIAAGMAVSRGSWRDYDIAFDGLVMIGNTVTVGKFFNREVPVEESVLSFPTYAAINWYHHHPTEQTLDEFTAEAKAFADHDYLLALYEGDSMSADQKEEVMTKVSYYSGASREYLLAHGLRFDDPSYRSEVLKSEDKAVARFDARITRPLYQPQITEEKMGRWDDASSDRYDAYFRAAVNGDIFPSLNISLDRTYVTSYDMREWNEEAKMGTTAERLRTAMYRTPGLRVFFANGWYDMATYTGIIYYTLNHAGLPMDRVSFKRYPSGHMVYLGEENVKALSSDIRSFITSGQKED